MNDEWVPPIEDDSGYRIRMLDLVFLCLGDDDVRGYEQRRHPLGMTRDMYEFFVDGLWRALERDEVTDADVRLKGSSANFYSGCHKRMPYSRREIISEFRDKYGRVPWEAEIEIIQNAIDGQWPTKGPRPLRRPFNALYRARIHMHPSDYDLQISSDQIFLKAQAEIVRLGLEPEDALVRQPTYAFIRKDLFAKTCRAVEEWRLTTGQFLRYTVTIAAFPSDGPPNIENDPETAHLSSHFRASDWIIHPPARFPQ